MRDHGRTKVFYGSMKIALNLMFIYPGLAGGRVYADNLLTALAAADPDHEYLLYTRGSIALPDLPSGRFRQIVAPVPGRSAWRRTLWEYAVLPLQVRRAGANLLHGVGTISPVASGRPLVLTIHDVIYRDHPESWGRAEWHFMRWVHPLVARRADRVIVPSQHTARAAAERLGVRPERVRVVPNGPGHALQRVTDVEAIDKTLRAHRVRLPFLVSVCRAYPHKNLAGLLRAFARLGSRRDLQLVLVGATHSTQAPLRQLVHELGLGDAVVFTGEVSQADLAVLYSAAELFAFPSLAEGFGMPVLEAMACGTPVVASLATAVPEVVGPAGVLADAGDPAAFAAALERVLGDAALRAELREKGLLRVREFGWDRCAAETLRVYRELA